MLIDDQAKRTTARMISLIVIYGLFGLVLIA